MQLRFTRTCTWFRLPHWCVQIKHLYLACDLQFHNIDWYVWNKTLVSSTSSWGVEIAFLCWYDLTDMTRNTHFLYGPRAFCNISLNFLPDTFACFTRSEFAHKSVCDDEMIMCVINTLITTHRSVRERLMALVASRERVGHDKMRSNWMLLTIATTIGAGGVSWSMFIQPYMSETKVNTLISKY